MKNDTMFATVFQDNPASARVLTNAGFVYLGDAETYLAKALTRCRRINLVELEPDILLAWVDPRIRMTG